MQNFPDDILNDLLKHLEEEKSNITERINQLAAQDPFSDPDRANDNAASDSEANEESSHDRFAAMVDQLKSRLSDIDAALSRIAGNSYGYCTNCKKMIDTDRLGVLPTATLCLSCEQSKKPVVQIT